MDDATLFWMILATSLSGFAYSAKNCVKHQEDHVEWFVAAVLLMIFSVSLIFLMGLGFYAF